MATISQLPNAGTSSYKGPLFDRRNLNAYEVEVAAYLGKYAARGYITQVGATPPADPAQLILHERNCQVVCSLLYDTLAADVQNVAAIRTALLASTPFAMWTAIRAQSTHQTAHGRFDSLIGVLGIRMTPGEKVADLANRIVKAAADWESSLGTATTVPGLIEEVKVYTLVHALPREYNNFVTTALLSFGGAAATVSALMDQIDIEDAKPNPLHRVYVNRVQAAITAPSTGVPGANPGTPSSSSISAPIRALLAQIQAASGSATCWNCGGAHGLDACTFFKVAQDAAAKARKDRNATRRKDTGARANAATTATITEVAAGGIEGVRHSVSSTLALLAASHADSVTHWNTDTGCTVSMTSRREWFTSYSPHRVPVTLADNSTIFSEGVGSVEFRPRIDGVEQPCTVVISRVLHVPSLGTNLLSVFRLMRDDGFEIRGARDCLDFWRDGRLTMRALVDDRMVGQLQGTTLIARESAMHAAADLDTWHQRFGHVDSSRILAMSNAEAVRGLKLSTRSVPKVCAPCLHGKSRRRDAPRSREKSSDVLAKVYVDLKTDLPRSREGYHYWVLAVDDASRFKVIKGLARKSDFAPWFETFVPWAQQQTGKRLRIFHPDQGGEFISGRVSAFCNSHGVEIHTSETGQAWHNGLVERGHGDVMQHSTAMLKQAGLPKSWWYLAASAYVHVANLLTSSSLAHGETPFGLFYGKKPDIAHLRIWGCLAYVHVPKAKRGPFDSRARAAVFVGYSSIRPGSWLFFDLVDRSPLESSSAVFVESTFPGVGTPSEAVLNAAPFDSSFADQHVPTLVDPASAPTDPPFDDPVEIVPVFGDSPLPARAPPPAPPAPAVILQPQPSTTSTSTTAPSTPPPPAHAAPPVPSTAAVLGVPGESVVPGSRRTPRSPVSVPTAAAPHPYANARPARTVRMTGSYAEPSARGSMAAYPTSRPLQNARPDPPLASSPAPSSAAPPAALAASSVPGQAPVDSDADDLLVPDDPAERVMLLGMIDLCLHKENMSYEQACEYAFNARSVPAKEPRTYKEAMQRPDAELWKAAAEEEIWTLIRTGTIEMVRLPPDRRAIGSQWVFKVKRNADGSIERYKARLVARGDAQRPGVDFNETFAPTVRWGVLRAIFALVALNGWHCLSADISSAFLNGDLEEEVYMRQAEGYRVGGKDLVWKLLKSLYGLRQAGRMWHQKLHEKLSGDGFRQVVVEHSVWVYERKSGEVVIVLAYVDDITVVSSSLDLAQNVFDFLKQHFKLRELGRTSWLLGVAVTQDESGRLSLSQRQYALDVLDRFGMSDCNPVRTPLDPNVRLSVAMCPVTEEDRAAMIGVPYMSALGALMYLAVVSRPDLSYALGVLARFQSNPGPKHWEALKRVLRYLRGTVDFMLVYSPRSPSPSADAFSVYSDADHAGCVDSGRSTTGMVVKIAGAATNWSSKLQSIVTLSTTEAEYVAACSSGQEVMFLRSLFRELGLAVSTSSTLFMDNMSAVQVARNPEHHGRMKHLDVKWFWLRERVAEGSIVVEHVRTDLMPADILTKALGPNKIDSARRLLGLYPSMDSALPS